MAFGFRGEGGRNLEKEVLNYSGKESYGVLSRVFNGVRKHGALALVGLAGLVGCTPEQTKGIAQGLAYHAAEEKVSNMVNPNQVNVNVNNSPVPIRDYDEIAISPNAPIPIGATESSPYRMGNLSYCVCSNKIATDKDGDGKIDLLEIDQQQIFEKGKIVIISKWKDVLNILTMIIKDKDNKIVYVNSKRLTGDDMWQVPFSLYLDIKEFKNFLLILD